MNNLIPILITWFVTSVSFFIISKLPIGVEIESFNTALVSAAVFGILNAVLFPFLDAVSLPFKVITGGLFSLVINAIIFGLAAYLVRGFWLRYGIWSALLGSLALTFVNSVLFQVLAQVRL